jgi:hypothetical protein
VRQLGFLASGLLVVLSSCGGAADRGSPPIKPRAPAHKIALGTVPRAVSRFCAGRAAERHFRVLCPTRYPARRRSSVELTASSSNSPSYYWASLNDPAGFPSGDSAHLIFGGQRKAFFLHGRVGAQWPVSKTHAPLRGLGFPTYFAVPQAGGGMFVATRPAVLVASTTVSGSRALILRAPSYPTGGFMGGHVIVLWNNGGHGYFVSLHFSVDASGHAYPFAARIATAVFLARTSRTVR